MKNDTPKTNYLANAQSSDYDALQRRIAVLIQHWMDHTSGVKPSKLISLLCDYIENTQFDYIKCQETEIFSTKSDFFLGLIVGHFIEIQDEKGESLDLKRKEIEKVLNQFSLLNHNKQKEKVNLQEINKPQTSLDQHETKTEIKWWLKFLDFFTKIR